MAALGHRDTPVSTIFILQKILASATLHAYSYDKVTECIAPAVHHEEAT
jgi:hypothetical protein